MLAGRCRARQLERAGRHTETISERLVADTAALRPLEAMPMAVVHRRGRASDPAWRSRLRCGQADRAGTHREEATPA
jgi:hypothetical protein